MKVTTIAMGDVRFPYRLGTSCVDEIVDRLADLDASRYLVVADTTVAGLYGHDLVRRIRGTAGPADLLLHQGGEEHKGLGTLTELVESALRLGADRRSVVVALGGGITGNIAGLMAALMFRGIRLVHVPTTIVAMLDSVLSLKQAVNSSVGKNLVGTFYQPVEVLADTEFLRTLSRREIRSGLCEVVKNALAIRPSMIDRLAGLLPLDERYDDEAMRWIIDESIAAKAQVTENDVHERGQGLVLEYGHTVGHALEHAARGEVSHGAAVGLGMLAEAEIARRLGLAGDDMVQLHRELIGRVGIDLEFPSHVSADDVRFRLRYDNKRGYLSDAGDGYVIVLLKAPGVPLQSEGLPLTVADPAVVDAVVSEFAHPATAAAIGRRTPVG
ncbi:3-dehydroquinate synthase [Streptoalloteichus tenebrarius]|uniref:2-deoxy-scyllo-inosose synthase n=2 Tax=Actinomycetes TaxID=1760 RepID=Q2MFJ4_STRSD|nr:2-deoxy-scyllo-inosose synthase [Streptoalloteichus tenebrarius]MCP2261346.1 3-dehydroquinate synthase [Streptoalloteichus tenebrarius]BFF00883.1 2-deoxy-scyllo-inosose synthase [Streptoalloteichus tenebrarius]CAF33047.1 2-deoxy-scyllo-inosose synthase [Streptoalloteichus tenebrarius]